MSFIKTALLCNETRVFLFAWTTLPAYMLLPAAENEGVIFLSSFHT